MPNAGSPSSEARAATTASAQEWWWRAPPVQPSHHDQANVLPGRPSRQIAGPALGVLPSCQEKLHDQLRVQGVRLVEERDETVLAHLDPSGIAPVAPAPPPMLGQPAGLRTVHSAGQNTLTPLACHGAQRGEVACSGGLL